MESSHNKSLRRHKLKEIDKKWKPTLEKGKEMASTLQKALSKKIK